MIHPGLVVPSDIERCMQLAYNAKYNSGCLSRQVGAVVTGPDFAVKSVGWNDVPNKQLECIYRDVHGYCKGNQKDCFSEFEYENETFKKSLIHIGRQLESTNLHGRKFSYCFKDIYLLFEGVLFMHIPAIITLFLFSNSHNSLAFLVCNILFHH